MRMIKVGERYLALVDRQADAIRFVSGDKDEVIRAAGALTDAGLIECRVVKLKTRADATGDSMRALAGDILDNGNS